MLLAVEIVLTAYACIRLERSGRKWALGLIPVLSGILIGFFIGLIAGLTGNNSVAIVTILGLIIDICVSGVLGWIILANKSKSNS